MIKRYFRRQRVDRYGERYCTIRIGQTRCGIAHPTLDFAAGVFVEVYGFAGGGVDQPAGSTRTLDIKFARKGCTVCTWDAGETVTEINRGIGVQITFIHLQRIRLRSRDADRRRVINDVDGQRATGAVAVFVGDHYRKVVNRGVARRVVGQLVAVGQRAVTGHRVIGQPGNSQDAVLACDGLAHYAGHGDAVQRDRFQSVYRFEGQGAIGDFGVGRGIAALGLAGACSQAGFFDLGAR